MKNIIFLVLLLSPLFVKAQNFEYQILYEGIGDNREYTKPIAYPQSILGSRGAFEIGTSIDNHKVRLGISELFEFGSDIDFHKPKLTLYYQLKEEKTEFIIGSFPRRKKIDFPLAMLSDTLLYYRPNIEGLFGEVTWDWGKQNAFVDWYGRQTDTQREQFMAGLSGEISHKTFFLQNYVLLFHDAHSKLKPAGQHIKDYFGYALQAGIRTTENSMFTGHVKTGVLSSSYRERNISDGFLHAHSFFSEAKGQYKNLGIKSTLNLGGSHNFNVGDSFYKVKNYLRTDLIWYFINHKNVRGKFNVSFHIVDWEYMDQQQQLSLIYILGN